jgi:hypothetical protein
MLRQTKHTGRWAVATAIALASVLLVAGCGSLSGAITSAIVKPAAPNAQPAPAAPEPAPVVAPAPAPTPAQSQPEPDANSAMAYQYQFNAFYSGMWGMGWFGYGDENYLPGQGTVWTYSGPGSSSSNSATFERALLKINADSSQWWRFKLDSGKHNIVYEFLVGSDTVVKKVRYQDTDSGAIGEFIPGQPQQQPNQVQSSMPKSRAEMAGYLVGKQQVQVKGGSFMADHYQYGDVNSKGTAEMWLSDKVPGYMVKTVYTSKKDNKAVTGELVKIESGVKTSLSSY